MNGKETMEMKDACYNWMGVAIYTGDVEKKWYA